MTIIELFPWLLAIVVALLSARALERVGLPGVWAWIAALALGIASFVAYWLALRRLASWSEHRRTEREKWEREHREYREFDPVKSYPVGKNLYYECLTCGNAIPSMPKRSVSCACRNITVEPATSRLTVQNHGKVKLFSTPG